MFDIEERTKAQDGKIIHVTLKANKVISLFEVKYPITWEGFINGEAVTIKQEDRSASSVFDYVFDKLPETFMDYKEDIVKIIDTFLKRRLD